MSTLLEELDGLIFLFKKNAQNYIYTTSDHTIRMLEWEISPLPNLAFLEMTRIETLEHYRRRRIIKSYQNTLQRLKNPFAAIFRKLERAQYEDSDKEEYGEDE